MDAASAKGNSERAKIDFSWNKRAWAFSLCLTGVSIAGLWLGPKKLDNSAVANDFRLGLYGPALHAMIGIVSIMMLAFVLPVLLPIVARRQPLLWGGLPLLGLYIYLWSSGDVLKQYFVEQSSWILVLWLFMSGILIRFLIRRRAIRTADDRSTAWPPAPKEAAGRPTPPPFP